MHCDSGSHKWSHSCLFAVVWPSASPDFYFWSAAVLSQYLRRQCDINGKNEYIYIYIYVCIWQYYFIDCENIYTQCEAADRYIDGQTDGRTVRRTCKYSLLPDIRDKATARAQLTHREHNVGHAELTGHTGHRKNNAQLAAGRVKLSSFWLLVMAVKRAQSAHDCHSYSFFLASLIIWAFGFEFVTIYC